MPCGVEVGTGFAGQNDFIVTLRQVTDGGLDAHGGRDTANDDTLDPRALRMTSSEVP